MNLSKVLEKVIGRQRQREAAKVNDFRSLVRSISEGKEPDADLVDRILVASGKNLEQLKSAVELEERRASLRIQLDMQPRLEEEQREIRKQLEQAHQVLTDAETKHEAIIQPLMARLEEIRDAIIESVRARHELLRTCSDETILAKLAELKQEQNQLVEGRGHVLLQISQRDQFVVGEHAGKAGAFEGDAVQEENARRAKATKAYERELAAIEKRLSVLETEKEELNERMMRN